VLETLTHQLLSGRHLSEEQARGAVEQLVNEAVAAAIKADFLSAFAGKGETVEEIAAFARALRERSIQPPLSAETRAKEVLDVVGTGGDRMNTFNISTTVAILCAAAGVPVAKHGNRAVTSQVGSADVLEALGIRIDLPPAEAARFLETRGFAFFFAPNYHPAFKHIAPARKLCAERGQRTLFNFLGPLLNPARPSAQLMGVPRPELCEPLARVLQSLGVRRAMVVCGEVPRAGAAPGHLDEFSTLGRTTIAEFYQERGIAVSVLETDSFPLQAVSVADLAGGDRQTNAGIVRRVLRGEERGPKRDAVLLNAAAALFVAGQSRALSEGWEAAAAVIDSGRAAAKLEELAGG
jgi:anthranilate phosphoribosyltransferase